MGGGKFSGAGVSVKTPRSRKHVGDGNRCRDFTFDLNVELFIRGEFASNTIRRRPGRSARIGIRLDRARRDVDDPIERDARRGVNARLAATVLQQRGIGYFNDNSGVLGTWMACRIGA